MFLVGGRVTSLSSRLRVVNERPHALGVPNHVPDGLQALGGCAHPSPYFFSRLCSFFLFCSRFRFFCFIPLSGTWGPTPKRVPQGLFDKGGWLPGLVLTLLFFFRRRAVTKFRHRVL